MQRRPAESSIAGDAWRSERGRRKKERRSGQKRQKYQQGSGHNPTVDNNGTLIPLGGVGGKKRVEATDGKAHTA